MKPHRLARKFFDRPTRQVAKDLLGKFLLRQIGKRKTTVMITEAEAYCGPDDLASHASRGRTTRTEVMFGPPGHAYIYLIYGMYHCLNIVAERDGYPAAVLIRGAITNIKSKNGTIILPRSCGFDSKNLGGPGRLCRHLDIDRQLNRENLISSKRLWLEDRGVKIKPSQIKRAKRIGVDYAGKYKDKPWRFVLVLDENGKGNNKKTGGLGSG